MAVTGVKMLQKTISFVKENPLHFIFISIFVFLFLLECLPIILGLPYLKIEAVTSIYRNYEVMNYSGFLDPIKDWIANEILSHKHLPLWLSNQGMGIPLAEQT